MKKMKNIKSRRARRFPAFRDGFAIELVVLNCCVTETNDPKSGSWVIATMGRIGAFDGHEHNTFDAFTSPGG
jgi:hypothetical protein